MKIEKKLNAMEANLGFLHQKSAIALGHVTKGVYDNSRQSLAVCTNDTINALIDIGTEAGIGKKKIKKIISSNFGNTQKVVSKKQRNKVFDRIDEVVDDILIPKKQIENLGIKKIVKKAEKTIESDAKKIAKLPSGLSSTDDKKDDEKKKKKKKIEKKAEKKAEDTSAEILDVFADIDGISDFTKKKKKRKKKTASFTKEDLGDMPYAN